MDEMIQQTNHNQPTSQPTNHRTKRRIMPWLVLGGGLLLVLLVGAAFVAGRLLAWQPPQKDVEVVQMGEGGESSIMISGELEEPEEMPDEKAAVIGIVTRRDGNSLFVGTGLTGVGRNRPDGSIEMEWNGPEVEVVVTHDTEIYEEGIETDTMQVFWEPGSLDDIAQGAVVRAWGEKRGDRVTARVLAYDLVRIELP